MKPQSSHSTHQSFLHQSLEELLNPADKLYKLANRIPWEEFEESFLNLYSDEGRPAKPIRLMVGLLL